MKCNNCGMDINPNDAFCSNCGAPVQKENVNNYAQNGNMYTYERNASQQDNYQQQSINSNYGQANNYNQQYSKPAGVGDKAKMYAYIIGGVILLVIIAVGIYLIVSKLGNNQNNSEQTPAQSSDQSNNVVSDNNQTSTTSGNGGTSINTVSNTNTTSNSQSSSYKVTYSGFKLYVPDNLIYEVDATNGLLIGDSELTWAAQIMIEEVPYEQMKKNKNQISTVLSQTYSEYGVTVSTANVETIGGVEFLWLEMEEAGEKYIIAYAKLNSMYTAGIYLKTSDGNTDKSMLANIVPIINTAEYTGDSEYLKMDGKINLNELDEKISKIIE